MSKDTSAPSVPDARAIYEDRETGYAHALKREGITIGQNHSPIEMFMKAFPRDLGWVIKVELLLIQ